MDPSGESRKYKNISRRLLLFAGESDKIHKSSEKGRRNPYGIVAQLGERRVRNAEVEGSSPFGSTKRKPGRKGRVFLLAGLFKGARTGACKKTARGAVFPRPDRARRARERAPSVPPKRKSRVSGFFFWYFSLFSFRFSLFSPFSAAAFSGEERREKREENRIALLRKALTLWGLLVMP